MKAVFSYILLAIFVLLAIYIIYVSARIFRIYMRARRLETMRGYETILYAALPKLGPERTMETLLPHPDPKALEEVLLRMGDEGAEDWKDMIISLYELNGFKAKRLRELHSSSKSRRSDAARRLGRISDPRAVPELKQLLLDHKEEVREAALFALGRMGTSDALEAMLEALDRGDRWSQEKVAEAVEEAGDESRSVLVDLLRDENPARRTFAAEVLGWAGGPEEAMFLVDVLGDEDENVRARAAYSLGNQRYTGARPALLETLEDPAWEVRSQVVKALGKIGNAEDAPRLARALQDKEWWVRHNAAASLREMGEAGEGPLVKALWSEDRFARETAAQALEESSVVERLVDDMREGKDDVQGERVIHRIAEIGSVGTIVQVLNDLADDKVRSRLVSLLCDIEDPELQKAVAKAEKSARRASSSKRKPGDEKENAEDGERGP